MRTLVFSLAYEPFIGGAELAVKELTARMDDIEFDVVTLRFDSTLPRYEERGNVRIHRIGFSTSKPSPRELLLFPLYLNKVFYPPMAAVKAFVLMRDDTYDCMWSIMSYMAYPAYFVSWFKKIPYIITLQDGDSIEHITKRLRIKPVYWLLRLAFRRAAVVQAISHFLAHFAKNVGYEGEVVVIPNGVDIKNFSKEISDDERIKIRNELGLLETDTVLVTSSRLVAKNGTIHVIRALPLLPSNIKFLICGDGELKDSLISEAKKLKVEDRIIFKGFVSHHELSFYLKASEIFIRPSLSEGMGSSFIEAMGAGVPVISTPVGGIVDFLHDGETGFMCTPADPESIAEQVKRIFENPDLVQNVVRAASDIAKTHYDWNLIAERMKNEVFDRVMSEV